MSAPTVAVVLSNYNHARYLPEALSAICGQTRPADQVVVIDDGSTDDSLSVIEDFARRDPRIVVARNERNLGLQASIARALTMVTTDYLVWAAADDRLLPGFLEASMAVLERHPHAALCFSEVAVLKGDTGEIERFAALPEVRHIFDLSDLPEYLSPSAVVDRMRRAYLPITSNSVVVRRDLLLGMGGYAYELEWFADSFVYTVLALRHGACVVPRTLALIRVTPGSYSQAGMRDPVRQARVLTALLDRLADPAYGDIRAAFRRAPSNLSPYGVEMLRLQLRRPRDWDLALPYLIWKVREYRRGHGLSWPRTAVRLSLRALEEAGLARVATMLRRALNLVRRGRRLVLSALRARREPPGGDPAGRLLGWIAHRGLRGSAAGRRLVHVVAAALLEESVHDDVTYAVGVLRGPVGQQVLRNSLLWQAFLLENPGIAQGRRVHAKLRVHAGTAVRLQGLFSLLCSSAMFEGLAIDLDDARTGRAVGDAFDLDARCSIRLDEELRVRLKRVLAAFDAPRRAAAKYLETAHPRAFVVAVSLPEDDEGHADDALMGWLPHFERVRAEFPEVAFVALNRMFFGGRSTGSARDVVIPVRSRGLDFAAAIALARMADAFVGVLDCYGLAAWAEGCPGVYADPDASGQVHRNGGQHLVSDAEGETCLGRLREVLEALAEARSLIRASGSGTLPVRRRDLIGPAAIARHRTMPPLSYTLIIPTYNRPALLARLLDYLERTGADFPVLVLDSGDQASRDRNAERIARSGLAVRHEIFPQDVHPYAKVREGIGQISTRYCSICADDDVVVLPALREAVQTLENEPGAALVHGWYFNFAESDTFDLSYIVYRGDSLTDARPLERVRRLFANYEAVFYGVYRREALEAAFRRIGEPQTILGRELMAAGVAAACGKVLRLQRFYYGRSTNASIGYDNWHPHQILLQCPEVLFTDYARVRDVITDAILEREQGAKPDVVRDVLDLVFLRYLGQFLGGEVLDHAIDDRMAGVDAVTATENIWRRFVTGVPRGANPTMPLLGKAGDFNPDRYKQGAQPVDYVVTRKVAGGDERTYRIFHEFVFPMRRPPAVVGRAMLLDVLECLNAY